MNYWRRGKTGARVSEISFRSWLTLGTPVELDASRVLITRAHRMESRHKRGGNVGQSLWLKDHLADAVRQRVDPQFPLR